MIFLVWGGESAIHGFLDLALEVSLAHQYQCYDGWDWLALPPEPTTYRRGKGWCYCWGSSPLNSFLWKCGGWVLFEATSGGVQGLFTTQWWGLSECRDIFIASCAPVLWEVSRSEHCWESFLSAVGNKWTPLQSFHWILRIFFMILLFLCRGTGHYD